ncbi:thioredoxin fold domain-containing protein [Leptospira sp. 'Mane']|uniref:thioredoxin fold domain-containing protein n=1 Tax=Leptospira sp. 'Mane' TaxID=3387407 RepID=UPI00398B1ABF
MSGYFRNTTFLLLVFVLPLHSETVWETSIGKGFSKAKSENKPILIDLYADWCAYCKVLEKEIFPDKQVSKVLEGFVTVRLNGEEFPNLMQKYGIEGYPTILYIDKDANLHTKLTGLSTKETVLRVSKKVLANPDIESNIKNELKKKPNDTDLYFRLGSFYYQTGNLESAKINFTKVLNTKPGKNKKTKEDSLFNLSLILTKEKNWNEATKSWKSFITEFPKSDHSLNSELYYGLCLKEAGETKLAKKILSDLRPRLTNPTDIETVDETLEAIRKGF